MRHDEIIRFRLSAALKQELAAAARAADEPLSAYIRAVLAAHATCRDAETERQLLAELVALRGAVGRLGNNLNQIAHHLNAGGALPAATPERIVRAAESMQRQVAATLDQRRAAR
ncbi:plasmid mobilization protein [Aquibaculum arenosum]|uniref:Plasmid mobilization relaxosome protein MobC n=1 Tax=Aquibaculum arenosum TaxID=3032591 RepID=A0ABT5YRZ4_9PROT|nr:plasmid mobilization relaxosome protein MobC [Fodinicurvata sp. CAU 1616]MDF2097525.1 plasmid mobilization relaxosome protein MobC [Fodinicurvata sp. CAU 1616]